MKRCNLFRKQFIAAALSVFCGFSFSFPLQILAAEEPGTESETVADAVSPVIDSVEVSASGETLSGGDSIIVRVSARGQQSPIVSVELEMTWGNDLNSNWRKMSVIMEQEEENLYTYERIIESVGKGTLYITQIKATDESGNVTFADVMDGENYKYSYQTEDSLSGGASLTFAGNNGTFQYSDLMQSAEQMGLSVLTEDCFSGYPDLTLKFQTKDKYQASFYFSPNEDNDYLFDQLYDIYFDEFVVPGRYDFVLTRAYVYADVGMIELNIPDKDQYRFSLNVSYSDLGLVSDPEIEKVEFSPNGELLAAGDVVQIRVSIDGFSEPENTRVCAMLQASAMIPEDTIEIELTYDGDTDTYCGIWEIDDAVYPCEWYLKNVYIDTGEVRRYVTNFENSQYVNVNNAPGFTDEKRNLRLDFHFVDEYGETQVESYNFDEVSRRFTMQDLKMALPALSSCHGIQQTGWATGNKKLIDEDTVLLNNGLLDIYAAYEKPIMPVTFIYVDSSGKIADQTEVFIFENGATVTDLENRINSYALPSELPDYEFTGWQSNDLDFISDPLPNACFRTVSARAEYKDSVVLQLYEEYIRQCADGTMEYGHEEPALIVKKGTTVHDLKEQLSSRHAEEMNPKMEFSGWNFRFQDETDSRVLENGEIVRIDAQYNKYCIECTLYDGDSKTIYASENYLEKGERFTLPESIEGILSFNWMLYQYGGKTSFVIGDDIQGYLTRFMGYGIKAPEKPDKETVDAAISEIENAADGDTVPIAMGTATVVPEEILTAVKGKNIDVVLNMENCTWTINGQNVSSDTLTDTDLGIKTDMPVIPDQIVQSVAGNNITRQLSLSHDGKFGFDAVLTLNVGMENAGKFSNLYYYTPEQKLEFIGSFEISENGFTALQFSHASDYLIVISETPVTAEPEPSVVFEDVAESSPYYDAIYWAAGNGITTGKTATTFAPDAGCTRAQFVTFLWRMQGEPEPQKTAGFADMVSSTSPFYKAISWAVEQGITSGYTDNTFRPNDTCSRGAAVTFLYRAAGEPELETVNVSFSDMVAENHAYYKGIVWAVTNKVTDGYKDGTFKPFRTCSRGQNVTFLYRAKDIL